MRRRQVSHSIRKLVSYTHTVRALIRRALHSQPYPELPAHVQLSKKVLRASIKLSTKEPNIIQSSLLVPFRRRLRHVVLIIPHVIIIIIIVLVGLPIALLD
jgi:hypothetical protein